MIDFAVSVFRLSNRRGLCVPGLDIRYVEKGTGAEWHVTCGGSRAYLIRYGPALSRQMNEQAADSHFMIRRVTSSLLLGGAGLFQPEPMGRVLFMGIEGGVSWATHLDQSSTSQEVDNEVVNDVYGWVKALCEHTVLRRAGDDAHHALSHPHEAMIFVYRGLEWLVVGGVMGWEDIAKELGEPVSAIRDLKKTANVDMGIRHATRSGLKLRASVENYGSWACTLFDALNAARARLDSAYKPMEPEKVAAAVMRAMPLVPYE